MDARSYPWIPPFVLFWLAPSLYDDIGAFQFGQTGYQGYLGT
jgi:hypothetical protein